MGDVANVHNAKAQIVKCADRISAPQQDTKWSWFVCFAGVVCNVITCGFTYSYGILFPSLLDEFQEGKAKTAWVGSLAMVGYGVYGPIAGKLYHRFGPRLVSITGALICVASLIATSRVLNINLMFLTYSIPFGIGTSFIYISVYLIVPRYFLKRRSLSLGLIAMGPGGGLFIMSPIVQALFDRLGWREAFLALTGLFIVICFLACTFRPIRLETDEVDNKLDVTGNFFNFSIFRNKTFMIYTTAAAVYYTGHYTAPVHMVRYWEELGFPEHKASRLYIFSGVSSLVIRPVIGRLHDVRWINPCYIYVAAAATEGVATLLLPLATTPSHFVVFFVIYGFADGTVGSGICIAILNILPERQRPLGFGVFHSITCVLSACGPALGGFVADIEGSYIPVFYMVGVLGIVGATMMLLVRCFNNPDELKHTFDSTVLESLIVVEKCSVV